ncbi:hypothetical protein PR048_024987 [Dryococelus australis]|uniref:Uncharacterized protein n=1 Tax=Dryococelus australis TaxID=614101 RepID=A0ABQ9GQ37_9NEOP|nr:hypothetical protein PR048_024987 [Dryococelus australis]
MPLFGGFSRGYPVFPAFAFRHCSTSTSFQRHQPSKASLLRVASTTHRLRRGAPAHTHYEHMPSSSTSSATQVPPSSRQRPQRSTSLTAPPRDDAFHASQHPQTANTWGEVARVLADTELLFREEVVATGSSHAPGGHTRLAPGEQKTDYFSATGRRPGSAEPVKTAGIARPQQGRRKTNNAALSRRRRLPAVEHTSTRGRTTVSVDGVGNAWRRDAPGHHGGRERARAPPPPTRKHTATGGGASPRVAERRSSSGRPPAASRGRRRDAPSPTLSLPPSFPPPTSLFRSHALSSANVSRETGVLWQRRYLRSTGNFADFETAMLSEREKETLHYPYHSHTNYLVPRLVPHD